MKKLFIVLALALLLVPAVVLAQPPAGCTWNGDPCLRPGYLGVTGPGINRANVFPGQLFSASVTRVNPSVTANWTGTCNTIVVGVPDTFCIKVTSKRGWVIATAQEEGWGAWELPSGYGWPFPHTIKASCTIGQIDTVIACMVYAKGEPAETCAPECGDCFNPNIRAGIKVYSSDTLILTVVTPPPALDVLQDSVTYVEKGVNPAFIPFTICNQDACSPPTLYGYNIYSGPYSNRIPAINVTGTITVGGGDCGDVYGEINAATALTCDYDTLTIIVWTTSGAAVYDTCVQLVHIVNPIAVPLFTVPVVTILVLALILAAAVFMRRRAVSRA